MNTTQTIASTEVPRDLMNKIGKLSVRELRGLKDVVDTKLTEQDALEKAKVREEVDKIMRQHGFDPTDIYGRVGPKKAAKYRNPNDASQTWSGRGRKPQWFTDAVHSGIEKEKMLIDDADETSADESADETVS